MHKIHKVSPGAGTLHSFHWPLSGASASHTAPSTAGLVTAQLLLSPCPSLGQESLLAHSHLISVFMGAPTAKQCARGPLVPQAGCAPSCHYRQFPSALNKVPTAAKFAEPLQEILQS